MAERIWCDFSMKQWRASWPQMDGSRSKCGSFTSTGERVRTWHASFLLSRAQTALPCLAVEASHSCCSLSSSHSVGGAFMQGRGAKEAENSTQRDGKKAACTRRRVVLLQPFARLHMQAWKDGGIWMMSMSSVGPLCHQEHWNVYLHGVSCQWLGLDFPAM